MSAEPIVRELSQPLKDKRVVITRAIHQAQELAIWLEVFGAKPLFYPAIEIAPPEDTTLLDAMLREIKNYDWLLFTSVNTVIALAKRLDVLALAPALPGIKIGVVGPVTAQAAEDAGFTVNFISSETDDHSLAGELPVESGMRVFLPQSSIAPTNLANALRARGAEVHPVVAYRTVRGRGGDPVPEILARGDVDAIVFSSSSTVSYFLERLANEGGNDGDLQGVVIACFGRSAVTAARNAGLEVHVVPSQASLDQLVLSLGEYFDAQ